MYNNFILTHAATYMHMYVKACQDVRLHEWQSVIQCQVLNLHTHVFQKL